MGKGITRRRYGSGHPRSGSRARALYPPRWTLRENPSSQPGRDLARKYKTAQNFRNWWLRIAGTHKREADARHAWPEHIRNKRYAAGRPSDFRPWLGACTESQLPLTAFRTHTPGVPR